MISGTLLGPLVGTPFSVKMCSNRVLGAETVNKENIQGYHMGDGVTFLYQSNKEYENIRSKRQV